MDTDLIKRFTSTYEFCDRDIYNLILLLRKGIYPYEYMSSWKRFNETLLPEKENFYKIKTCKVLRMMVISMQRRMEKL